jgi:hypothetical protein
MRLAPNEVLDNGRYVLREPCGADERAGLEFWRALDTRSGSDVALTVVVGDAADTFAVTAARHVLEGARYGETAAHPALAPVLDVPSPDWPAAQASPRVLGFVVARWTPGVDLVDSAAAQRLSVAQACRLLRPLVAAVDLTHHYGVVAGVDAPGRIRVTEEGTAVVAFRGTSPVTTTRDDIRGLGAVLYLLLTGRWPVADRAGMLVPPAQLRPDVPRDLSTVAVLALDSNQGPDIRTCGPLLKALDEGIAHGPADVTAPLPRLRRFASAPVFQPMLAPEPPVPVPAPVQPERPPREPRQWVVATRAVFTPRRLVVAGVTLLIALVVLVGTEVAGSFGVASTAGRPATTSRHPAPTTTKTTTTTTTTTTQAPPPPPPPAVTPSSVREYVLSGSEDNRSQVGKVIDGDPSTGWPTDNYRQQFPSFQPGIGLMVGFDQPRPLSALTITSPSVGTVVEIHAASAPDAALSDSPLLATATLQSGATTIPLPSHPNSPYLLVWITKLQNVGGGYQSVIDEISAQPVS